MRRSQLQSFNTVNDLRRTMDEVGERLEDGYQTIHHSRYSVRTSVRAQARYKFKWKFRPFEVRAWNIAATLLRALGLSYHYVYSVDSLPGAQVHSILTSIVLRSWTPPVAPLPPDISTSTHDAPTHLLPSSSPTRFRVSLPLRNHDTYNKIPLISRNVRAPPPGRPSNTVGPRV